MHRVESRFVIGSPNILSAAVYVCTFQPGNVTGGGSEGVTAFVSFLDLACRCSQCLTPLA